MAFDQVIRCQPQSRQSDRGLLSGLKCLVTYRDRRTRGPQCCRLLASLGLGNPLISTTILREPPQPNQVRHSLKETTQHQGHCTNNSYLLCLHTTEFKPSSSKSRHHELLSPCLPGETEAMVQQVISKIKRHQDRNSPFSCSDHPQHCFSQTDDLSYSSLQ